MRQQTAFRITSCGEILWCCRTHFRSLIDRAIV